jgi:hypothetical protein
MFRAGLPKAALADSLALGCPILPLQGGGRNLSHTLLLGNGKNKWRRLETENIQRPTSKEGARAETFDARSKTGQGASLAVA